MKIRVTWDEFIELAFRKIQEDNLHMNFVMPPAFKQVNSYEPEGDHYDYPSFVEFEVAVKK